jgi:diaminopimelate epimerase
MHGAGNDFIVIDGIHQDLSDIHVAQWRFLADRQFGIGADQILLIERPTRKDADFKYRIINHDGSEVEQCGNGSRCFVRFVREKNLTTKKKISVEVAHTLLTLTEKDEGLVEVNMGTPILDNALIPFHRRMD